MTLFNEASPSHAYLIRIQKLYATELVEAGRLAGVDVGPELCPGYRNLMSHEVNMDLLSEERREKPSHGSIGSVRFQLRNCEYGPVRSLFRKLPAPGLNLFSAVDAAPTPRTGKGSVHPASHS